MKHSYLLVCSAIFLFGCPMMGGPGGKQKNQNTAYEASETGQPDSVTDSNEEEELPCNDLYDECVTNGVEQDICNGLLAECEYNEQVAGCEDLYEDCIADHISPELCGDMLQDCLSVDNPDEEAAADSDEEDDDDNEAEEEDTEQASDDNQSNDQQNDNEQDPE